MNSSELKTKINLLLSDLDKLDIIDSLVAITGYPDEPQMFRYSVNLKKLLSFTDGNDIETTASGFSFESPSLALMKCLVELIERFCTMSYRSKNMVYSSFHDLKDAGLNPNIYVPGKMILSKNLSWSWGYDLLTGVKILLPAQTVYYNYKLKEKEPYLTIQISTGAAGGFDFESTILRGIYEIIERDAFMNVYLAQIKAPKIKLASINNDRVKWILEKTRRYNLEVLLFDLTSDLGIPSFLGVTIDRTGLGPSISLGLKSSCHQTEAIVGSLEESLLTRPWMRNEMLSHKKNDFKIRPQNLNTIKDRGLFWVSPKMIKNFDFLFNQFETEIALNQTNLSVNEELNHVKDVLKNNNLSVYYSDLSSSKFELSKPTVLKVNIPQLQPVFFYEKIPEIRHNRLKQVAKHFNKQNFKINKIPHPFL